MDPTVEEYKTKDKKLAMKELGIYVTVDGEAVKAYICGHHYGREVLRVYIIPQEGASEGSIYSECQKLFDGEEFVNEHEYRAQPNRVSFRRLTLDTGCYDSEQNYYAYVAGCKYYYTQTEGTDD